MTDQTSLQTVVGLRHVDVTAGDNGTVDGLAAALIVHGGHGAVA